MSSKLERILPELVKENLISIEQSENIVRYIESKKSKSNFLLTVFGILGALLVSLGIILIIAHNWDDLTKPAKSILAFIPLLIGQALCLFAILKNKASSFKESSATFLFFAIAASISMIAQIYHISGDFEKFLLTWCLLALPIIYLMPSNMVSLLFIALVTVYGCNAGYGSYYHQQSYWHWLLLLSVFPFVWKLYKTGKTNFHTWHYWFLAAAITILLGSFGKYLEEYIFMAYLCLFSAFLLVSHLEFFKNTKLFSQPFFLGGMAGTFSMLLAASFDWYWKDLSRKFELNFSFLNIEVVVFAILFVTALLLLIYVLRKINYKEFNPAAYSFLVFTICFFLFSHFTATALLIINLWIFYLGVRYIIKGSQLNNLMVLNFGLIIITALITCRYFDTSISFVIRGILFLLIGCGFFGANYWMVKKRKKMEREKGEHG